MNRPTRGPWIYYNTGATQNGCPVYTLTSLAHRPAAVHDGTWIADIRMGREDDDVGIFEGAANARLITTAPDLLAACLAALDELRALLISAPAIAVGAELDCIGQLQAAVARAEGRPCCVEPTPTAGARNGTAKAKKAPAPGVN